MQLVAPIIHEKLHSPRVMQDAFGQRRVYVSGAGLQNNSVPPDSVGYGGQLGNVTDVESGLVLMGFRYYSPFYCRFLTRDPSGYGGGINLYAYCRNNPINNFDPEGLQWYGPLPTAQQNSDFWHAVGDGLKALGSGTVKLGKAAGHLLYEGMEAKRMYGNPLESPPSSLAMGEDPIFFLPEGGYGPHNGGDPVVLYRGLPSTHPGYNNATNGKIVPRGGTATAAQHSEGNTQSNYTSWTESEQRARGFANYNKPTQGIVVKKSFNLSDLLQSGSHKPGEKEHLVTGIVTGAKSVPMKKPGRRRQDDSK